METEQYRYLIHREPSSGLRRWTLYNPLGRGAARSVETYYRKQDCLAAIDALKASGSAPAGEG